MEIQKIDSSYYPEVFFYTVVHTQMIWIFNVCDKRVNKEVRLSEDKIMIAFQFYNNHSNKK